MSEKPTPQCPTCLGRGYVWVEGPNGAPTPKERCPECKGSGAKKP